jgi:peptidoglycan/LPS O-acetylase OafA/YrhL
LRGLSVAAVLAFHSGFGWAAGGYLGVSAFFTLSGFLITTLLLTEWRETGWISLRHFWSRRLRRLMPAALVGLAMIVLFGVAIADADQLRELRGDVLAALCYVANWRFIYSSQSYADLFAEPSPVLHFWSLAIEEQFYFLFPLVAVAALRRRGPRAFQWTLVVLAAASVAAGLWLLATEASVDRLYYGTDTRAFELLVGALLACALARGATAPTPRSRFGTAALRAAGALALAAMLFLWATVAQSDRVLHRGGLWFHALLAAIVVAAAVQPRGPVRVVLAREPLRRLGLISYGVYVYHWPVFLWLDAERTGLSQVPLFAVRAATTLALAALSYHLLERPIRDGQRLAGRRPLVAAPVLAGAVCVALVAVTADPPAPAIVYEAVRQDRPLPPPPSLQSASGSAPPRVLIVGDSVAETVGRGIERWGATTRKAVVLNAGLGFCAIGRGGVAYIFGTRPKDQVGCNDWSKRWDVEGFRPDVVVVLSTLWELFPRELPQWDGRRSIGDAEYDRWLISEYTAAVDFLASRGARIVWLTMPCTKNKSADEIEKIRYLNRMIKGLEVRVPPESLRVVDLYARVCPNGSFTRSLGGIDDARADGLHFTDGGSDWLAAWLGPQLIEPFAEHTARRASGYGS